MFVYVVDFEFVQKNPIFLLLKE